MTKNTGNEIKNPFVDVGVSLGKKYLSVSLRYTESLVKLTMCFSFAFCHF